ncbi:CPBP family intramembrane glutamic endopeptidase [Paenibacillus sedimenti]|uniref:CPBP family intramembrane metalloprotease n=1 Tax=Paenibacillus sedimenti TaxID=2770274 RepID=A0A926QJV9_9BACL|nr:type II CAAX endopeptidase family protein [Paenibacillus sedimenti]MBD0381118.1 CPBP family intramembrane metalloprotease [Paenibacillus sedimenti]
MTLIQRQAKLILLVVYLGTMIPAYFYLTKWMIIGIPILTTFLTLYLLRHEYIHLTVKSLMDKPQMGAWIQKSILFSILVQFIYHFMTNNTATTSLPFQLMQQYPVMPIYMLANAPIVEEVIFRKIIFHELDKRTPSWFAAVVSSILFGMLHYSWIDFFMYFSIGLIFCYIFKKSQSITPTMIGHVALNFIFIVNVSLNI